MLFTTLAVLSLGLLIYEVTASPSKETIDQIIKFDFVVASMFLFDFIFRLFRAKKKAKFLKQNWYLLPSSIPLTTGWVELLRPLRILGLFRLIRAEEHIRYSLSIENHK